MGVSLPFLKKCFEWLKTREILTGTGTGQGLEGTGRVGMGRDGTGQDGTGRELQVSLCDNRSAGPLRLWAATQTLEQTRDLTV